jgi:hypothetical protein
MHNARRHVTLLQFCKRFPGWVGGRYELRPFEGFAPGDSVDTLGGSQAHLHEPTRVVFHLQPISQCLPHPVLLPLRSSETPANSAAFTGKENIDTASPSTIRTLPRRPASSEELIARQCAQLVPYPWSHFPAFFFECVTQRNRLVGPSVPHFHSCCI